MSLLSRLDLATPIFQAPMAGISTPLLAAKVSNAGGLGSLGLGSSSPSTARKSILQLKSMLEAGRPYHVNMFVHPPLSPTHLTNQMEIEKEQMWIHKFKHIFKKYNTEPPTELKTIYKSFSEDEEDILQVLLETKPPVISFHFGLPPTSTLEKLRRNDPSVILLAAATNILEAEQIVSNKLDGIIAQGYEAGGHRGSFISPDEKLSTWELTRILLEKYKGMIPIISAGGIMDGYGIKKYMEMGVQAVQLGTVFVSCPESAADYGYRELLSSSFSSSSSSEDSQEGSARTKMTSIISGRPARTLLNEYTAFEYENEIRQEEIPSYPRTYDLAKQIHSIASRNDDWGYGAYWAGEGVSSAKPRALPADELVRVLMDEYRGINSQ